MVDAITTVETLLRDNWNEDNVSMPRIFYNESGKISGAVQENGILLYENTPKTIAPAGLGTSHENEDYFVSVDIKSFTSRSYAISVEEEVERIINNNIINPDSSFDIVDMQQRTDRSSSKKRFFHMILDLRLRRLARARNT